MKKLFSMFLAVLMVVGLAACSSSKSSSNASEGDKSKVVAAGKLVVGITDFEPMDYKDDKGNWTGFDAELATEFAKSLGVEVEFVEIDWDNKIMELDGGSIDCVWNGMTLTDEVKSAMNCSDAYLNNKQIVVVPAAKADQYQTEEAVKKLKFAVESGSSGEAVLKELGCDYTPVSSQANALTEVKAGTSEAAMIDSLMASAMVGEGTSYADLTTTLAFGSEEYGVGFRKDSDLTAELNKFLADKYADGTIKKLAEKYKVDSALING